MNDMIHKAGGWLVFPKASANLRSWARIPARDVFWEKALCVLFTVAQQNIPPNNYFIPCSGFISNLENSTCTQSTVNKYQWNERAYNTQ